MPGAVPNTSTYALTNATLPYAVALANKGWEQALRDDHSLALGLNTHAGTLTNEPRRRRARDRVGRPRTRCWRRHRDVAPATAATSCARAVRTYLDHLARRARAGRNTLTSYRRDLRRYLEFLDRRGVDGPRRGHRGDGHRLPGRAARGRRRPPAAELRPRRRARWSRCAASTSSRSARAGHATTRPAACKPPAAGQAAAQGAAAGRRRGDPGGRRGARHDAGAAGPGAARGALRHRRADLRGGGARRRRPRHRRPAPCCCAARAARSGSCRSGSYALAAVDAYLVRGRPELAGRPATGTPALFLNARGGRLSRQSAWTVLVKAAERAGVTARRLAAHPAALVRHPPARRRRRRPGGAGAARPRLGDDDPGLHAGHRGQPARGVRQRAPARQGVSEFHRVPGESGASPSSFVREA